VSIPTVLDPSLAPPGKHVVHAYYAGNEPYALWEGLKRGSPEYEVLKEERSQVLWAAVERIIPDIRARCEVTLAASPLTHEAFNRRHRGSYGPGFKAGKVSCASAACTLLIVMHMCLAECSQDDFA
jgi:phytoene dehydrogenase-like protein